MKFHPRARSSASWTTTLKANFLLWLLMRKDLRVPPGRYSTTTQQRLRGMPMTPFSVCMLRSGVPIAAPINCKNVWPLKMSYILATQTIYAP